MRSSARWRAFWTEPITALRALEADRLWNQAGGPGCIDYLTLGIDKPSDCFAASMPGLYPGATAMNKEFEVSVPTEAGVYPIRIGFSQVFDCKAALAGSLSDTQVGVLVVTP